MNHLRFCIIGSGASGMGAAKSLKLIYKDCKIDIFEKADAPFGLIRYGVSPDHLSIKNISFIYQKLLEKTDINLFLNSSITNSDVFKDYSAIIYATGGTPNKLSIKGSDSNGVVLAHHFYNWYNNNTEYRECPIDLKLNELSIIGNGNASLDIARNLLDINEKKSNYYFPEIYRELSKK